MGLDQTFSLLIVNILTVNYSVNHPCPYEKWNSGYRIIEIDVDSELTTIHPFPDFVNASPKLGFDAWQVEEGFYCLVFFGQEEGFREESAVFGHLYPDCGNGLGGIQHFVNTYPYLVDGN